MSEGVDQVLLLLSTRGRVQTPDLLEEWMDYLHSNSLIRSESFARNALWSRLRYLVTRGLASQNGSYSITPEGEAYLEAMRDGHIKRSLDVTRAAVRHNAVWAFNPDYFSSDRDDDEEINDDI